MSQTETAKAAITLDKVNKWYGPLHVLRDISLTVH
jgi:ABC-type polar amino acid transport system ATPase subunit